MPSVRRLYKGIEGEDWGEVYEPCKEMRAVGEKKPQEAQSKSWKMKAAKDAGEG